VSLASEIREFAYQDSILPQLNTEDFAVVNVWQVHEKLGC
jgi:hypothetical protein